jgi:alpha-beta hydrolase superfamily lysophospholipase
MYKISPGMINKSNLDINALSHDKEIVRLYKEDPLVHNKISLELLFSAMIYGIRSYENIDKLDIPMLLMHGSDDKITSFNASKKLYEKDAKMNNLITFKEWPDMYHELHNEANKDEVFEYLISWIETV